MMIERDILFVGLLLIISIAAISTYSSYLQEKKIVERMTEICEQDYNRSYLYHDTEYFYCVRYMPRSTLDLPEIDTIEIKWKNKKIVGGKPTKNSST